MFQARIHGRCGQGVVTAAESSITVEKTVLDTKGNPQPTGEYESLAADSVVLALGHDALAARSA